MMEEDIQEEPWEEEFSDLSSKGQALIKRGSIQLAQGRGEWIYEEQELEKGALSSEVEEDIAVPPEESAPLSDNLYTAFSHKVSRIPRLSEEEERALGIKVIQSADEASIKKLVLHNMRLAIKMAYQYRRAWTNLMDLVQEALSGMTIAAKRWDPNKGTKFGTYAAYWMRAQLTKFLITNGRLIHTGNTRSGRKIYFNLPHVRKKLLANGIHPSAEMIAHELGEDPKEVALVLARLEGHEASLQAPLGEGGGTTLQDTLGSQEAPVEEEIAKMQMQNLIHDLIIRFEKTIENERERAMWREHLIAQDPISLVELGLRYGVTKQRMGQLATKLKKAFRRHVIDELGPDTQLSWLFSYDT